jgi:DNA mismatch endonuclease (patch repair protein)
MTESTPELRSRIMRAVKGRDTGPEMLVRRLAFNMGYRYRLHRADLPGKPDLVFASRHKIIFVHGCFWHGHDCPRGARQPKQNAEYWLAKISGNRERDKANLVNLHRLGWKTLIIWECELKEPVAVKCRIADFLDNKEFVDA